MACPRPLFRAEISYSLRLPRLWRTNADLSTWWVGCVRPIIPGIPIVETTRLRRSRLQLIWGWTLVLFSKLRSCGWIKRRHGYSRNVSAAYDLSNSSPRQVTVVMPEIARGALPGGMGAARVMPAICGHKAGENIFTNQTWPWHLSAEAAFYVMGMRT